MTEIRSLMQEDIPAAKRALGENYANLQQVAEYVENNYAKSEDKTQALQEAKAFTAQSLASVAYQINNLAEKVLRLLDLQASEIPKIESSINCISQKVDMHKEKVARREIGSFTASKTLLRVHKIVPPAIPEQREKYSRKPIVYTILDDIGHGMKETNHQLSRSRTMSQRHGHPSVPTSPTVPAQGTLGRNFRTSGPVQPPVVPSGYSSPVTSAIDPPPLFRSNDTGGSNMFGSTPLPPPPPLPTHQPDGDGLPDPLPPAPMPPPPPPPPPTPQLPSDDLPPPPPQFSDSLLPPPPPMPPSDVLSSVTDCPPPPPPCDYMPDIDDCAPPPPPPVDYTDETPNSPTDYIEKVIAIYTYNKSKDDELSFQEGDVIYVTAKNEDGWYKGFSAGASGFFPGNYVQVTD